MAGRVDGTLAGGSLISSIGRPLDRRYATNRAVLIIMPAAGAIAGVVALLRGASALQVIGAIVAGAVAVFGVWALARELAPDNNAAAFVSMALGFAALTVVEPLAFLVLFATMFLVRVVNRTVGPPARLADSIAVSGLAVAVVYLASNPLFGSVAALAFALDASLRPRWRRHWVFAVLCLLAAGAQVAHHGVGLGASSGPGVGVTLFLAITVLGFAVTIARTRVLDSVADMTGERLVVSRVQGGMLIALLVALQTLLLGQRWIGLASLVWAALAGVAATGSVTPAWRSRLRNL